MLLAINMVGIMREVGAFFGLGMLTLLSTVDIVVAVIAAMVVGPGVLSKRLSSGAMLKVLQIIAVSLAFIADITISTYAPTAKEFIPIAIGRMTALWFILGETISIFETLHKAGVPLPLFIVRGLAIARRNIDTQALDAIGGESEQSTPRKAAPRKTRAKK